MRPVGFALFQATTPAVVMKSSYCAVVRPHIFHTALSRFAHLFCSFAFTL